MLVRFFTRLLASMADATDVSHYQMRTILPQDFYVEMVDEGELIGTYYIAHSCDVGGPFQGQTGNAIHSRDVEGGIEVKCDSCDELGFIQQK